MTRYQKFVLLWMLFGTAGGLIVIALWATFLH